MRDADEAAIRLLTRSAFSHALPAEKLHPDEPGAPLGGHDPRAILPWRVMSHVLAVSALELRNPVPFVIGVEADNATRDRVISPVHDSPLHACRHSETTA